MNILNKAIMVTRSCKTLEQLQVAIEFNILAGSMIAKGPVRKWVAMRQFEELELDQKRKIEEKKNEKSV
ncbi:MAG: hypothetical protein WC503_04260 [Candidatus Shapirobacteria bacterium]